MISVVQLGTLDYATGLRLQKSLVEMRKEGRTGDVLLLLEHAPVITLGRNAKAANVLASAEQLQARGVEVFECDRGGDVTFHGPGQLVGYPIFDLREMTYSRNGERKTLGVIEYVRRLEEALILTCTGFGISTQRVPGLTGVWTRPVSSDVPGKIAAIGVHISRGVTSHGFALNVNTDLEYFSLIVPCGITSKPVTSMSKECGQGLSMEAVTQSVSHNFGIVFDQQVVRSETLDALVNTVGVPMKPPAELHELHGDEDTSWA